LPKSSFTEENFIAQIALSRSGEITETSPMRRNLILGLATISFAFAAGAAMAAPVDALTSPRNFDAVMSHGGAGGSGFMALKSPKNSNTSSETGNLLGNLSAEMVAPSGAPAAALMQPNTLHAWGNGSEALAARKASPSVQAAMMPPASGSNADVFSSVKQSSGLRRTPSPEVQSLSTMAPVPQSLYSPH
jgi:hypothetical protein